MKPTIAIDTETGGLQPGRHALLSIAAIASWDEDNPLMLYVMPTLWERMFCIDPQAARINGYSAKLWRQRGAVPLLEAMAQLRAWLTEKVRQEPSVEMVCHNAIFDVPFLQEASRKTGVTISDFRYRWRCSMMASGGYSLARLATAAGYPIRRDSAVHDAAEDARACLRGWEWLKWQKSADGGVMA
jgi:DNA polymerase III epsilon subunit-like protein